MLLKAGGREGGREGERVFFGDGDTDRGKEGREGGLTNGASTGGDAADGVFRDGDTPGLLEDQFLLDLELFHAEELREGEREGGREGGRERGVRRICSWIQRVLGRKEGRREGGNEGRREGG